MTTSHIDMLILQPPGYIWRQPEEALPTVRDVRYVSLGGLSMATYLCRHGFRAMVAPLQEFYQEQGCYLDFDDGTEASRARFTRKTDRILDLLIERVKPRALGITLNYAMHHQAAEIILDLLRQRHPGLPVLMGGVHATFTAETWLLRKAPANFVILGEGEETCRCLMASDLNPAGISGLALRSSTGECEFRAGSPPLSRESISYPLDLDLVALPRWSSFREMLHFVAFSRGCSWRCAFCCSPNMWGHWRFRDPAAAATEIQDLHGRGIREIAIVDEAVIPNSAGFEKIASVLRRTNDIAFSSFMRVDHLERTDPKVLRDANICQIRLGIESFSQKIINLMNKKLTLPSLRAFGKTLQRYQNAGIEIAALIMIGYPGGGFAEDLKTVRALRSLARDGLIQDIIVAHSAPFPGTELGQAIGSRYRICSEPFNSWTHSNAIVELLDSRGRVTYSSSRMQQVFLELQAIRQEFGLGPFRQQA